MIIATIIIIYESIHSFLSLCRSVPLKPIPAVRGTGDNEFRSRPIVNFDIELFIQAAVRI